MNRQNSFEKSKIAKASTNKVVCNIYLDSFGIEKVRFQNANYDTKESINGYLDFEDIALLAQDAASGRLIKQLDEGPINLSIGGSKSSTIYDGAPESRIISLGKSGDKIFFNMSRGKGKLGDNGQIIPDGKPDLKIGVPMEISKFRSMMIYTHDCVNAYLCKMITKLAAEAQEERKKGWKQDEQ